MHVTMADQWAKHSEKDIKKAEIEYLNSLSKKEKIHYLTSEVNKLQDQLTENISKALDNTKDLDKLNNQSQSLLRSSRKFYKKSRKTNLYQNGCCGCIFIILREFFSAIINCIKKACCCCCSDDSEYENIKYQYK
jgi:hypothetical protein